MEYTFRRAWFTLSKIAAAMNGVLTSYRANQFKHIFRQSEYTSWNIWMPGTNVVAFRDKAALLTFAFFLFFGARCRACGIDREAAKWEAEGGREREGTCGSPT